MTLEAGADLKSTNRYGGTALIPAAHHGHVETVRILLRTAIDKDHVNKLGWTALLEAVILGDGGPAHTEIVRLLVEAGANPNIADRDGVTPLAHMPRSARRPLRSARHGPHRSDKAGAPGWAVNRLESLAIYVHADGAPASRSLFTREVREDLHAPLE